MGSKEVFKTGHNSGFTFIGISGQEQCQEMRGQLQSGNLVQLFYVFKFDSDIADKNMLAE